MHFFHSIWKNLHLTENFYTDMSVVSVTNMRYGRREQLKGRQLEHRNKIHLTGEPPKYMSFISEKLNLVFGT